MALGRPVSMSRGVETIPLNSSSQSPRPLLMPNTLLDLIGWQKSDIISRDDLDLKRLMADIPRSLIDK